VPAIEERKLVTVLFADIVGSTALASAQDPERVRALMDRFYEAMQQEVGASGGTVEKFAGDAVLASFGAPTAQEDHAERALHTALSMCRRVEELFGEQLAIRVGVNTGEVVVGPARAGGSFLTGDAVNVAARLEQAAEPGEILVGERTVAAVRGAFKFEAPTIVEAKGKPEGVGCCRLVSAVTLMRPRGIAGRQAVFVGRRSELELLQATYRRVASQREPHLVTLVGDPGVGKTRLVRELWGWLADEAPRPFRGTGRCLPYGQIAYWAIGEVLKEHLGLREDDPPERVRERLGEREILGLALGRDVAGDLHPLAARERLHEAWVSFLGELVAEQPAVLLFEDLHWAEEPLLDLLERTARDVQGPLFLIATARPELLDRRPGWSGGRRNASTLWVEALSPDETALLADELLATRFSAELREAIVERAEGNPFFVEELVAAVTERGGEGELPDSVQALLAARVDLLPPTEKAGLQAAAVIGRTFWPGPVRELLGGEEPDWALLEDRDFVRRRPASSISGETEYAIKHALTREVAYRSLPKAKRARLHAGFSDWLERFGEGRDEHAALLAHHYAEAARPEDADLAWAGEEAELERLSSKAIAWLRRAGELAIGRYEIDEGLSFLQRAVELGPEEVERTAIWREIGRANALKFDGPAFWEAMQESLKTCSDRVTCGETYSLLAFHTVTRSGMWKRRPDRELVDGWIERGLELTEQGSAAHVRTLVARAYWSARDEVEPAREASALADRLGDPELRSYAWMARAAAAFNRGDFEQAFTWAQRRFDLLDEISDPDHVTEMIETAMPTTAALGRFREARRLSWEHVDRSKRLTPHHRVHGISLVTETEELTGEWETIRALTPDIEEAVENNRATPCTRNARTLLTCAAANFYEGDELKAASLETAANDLGMESPALSAPRIRLALARGSFEELRRIVEADPEIGFTWGLAFRSARLDALAALRDRVRVEAEAAPFTARRSYLQPFALRALGIVREDEKLVEQAQERFAALRMDWHAAQTEVLVQQA
jgi:class 3 adenylate cyclase/tetratricopeptide (TPR) repeat protein